METRLFLALLGAALAFAVAHATLVDYSYAEAFPNGAKRTNGPSKWSEIKAIDGTLHYPSCAATPRQSPINVASADLTGVGRDPREGSLAALDFNTGNVRVRTMLAVNDGAQLYLSLSGALLPTTATPAGSTNLATPVLAPRLSDAFFPGVSYKLDRVMFRTPSEHTFGTNRRDAELQFYYNQVPGSGDPGSMVAATPVIAVAVTLEAQASFTSFNPELDQLIAALPAAPADTATAPAVVPLSPTSPTTAVLDVTKLLPPERSYATYEGSLTHPPCTEGVRWYVFHHAVPCSSSQLDALAALLPTPTTDVPKVSLQPAGNFRTVQGQNNAVRGDYRDRGQGTNPTVVTTQPNVRAGPDSQSVNLSIAALVFGALAVVLGFAAMLHVTQRMSVSATNPNAVTKVNGGDPSGKYKVQ